MSTTDGRTGSKWASDMLTTVEIDGCLSIRRLGDPEGSVAEPSRRDRKKKKKVSSRPRRQLKRGGGVGGGREGAADAARQRCGLPYRSSFLSLYLSICLSPQPVGHAGDSTIGDTTV